MKTVGIFGAGTMGIGVAYVFAEHNYNVILIDNQQSVLNKVDELLEQSYKTQCFFGNPKKKLDELKKLIHKSQDISELACCDYLIDNTTESFELKSSLLSQLKIIIKPDCLVVINTSCISIKSLTPFIDYPHRMLGIHFMNPAPIKSFVEIIRTNLTSQETLDRAREMLSSLGKSGVIVEDKTGFVINRVFMVTLNEAIKVFEENLCQTAAHIDELFVKCLGHKMGPLMTADLIGLDTVLHSLNVLYSEFQQEMYLPAKLLVDLVEQGQFGRKTGIGLYQYERM